MGKVCESVFVCGVGAGRGEGMNREWGSEMAETAMPRML